VLLSSNEFDELRRENRNYPTLLSHCAVLIYVITCLARLVTLSRQENECFS